MANALWSRSISGVASFNQLDLRHAESMLFSGPTPTRTYAGAVAAGSFSVSGSTLTVPPLTFVMEAASSAGTNGTYRGVFAAGDPNLTQTLAAANATYGRIDTVYIRCYDQDTAPSDPAAMQGQCTVEVVTGTPATTPVAPNPPSGANTYTIGNVTVPKAGSGSATVTPLNRAWRLNGAIDDPYYAQWTPFASTWRAGGSPLALRSGTLLTEYRNLGQELAIRWSMQGSNVSGTPTDIGTGSYTLDLPTFLATASYLTDIGSAQYTLGSKMVTCSCGIVNTSAPYQLGIMGPAGRVGSTTESWSAGDGRIFSGSIRIRNYGAQ